MDRLSEQQLLDILSHCGEPLLVVRLDKPDWPIVFANEAFDGLLHSRFEFFGDLLDRIVGRERAMDISDAMRARRTTSVAVEVGGREYLLNLSWPGHSAENGEGDYCAVYFRSGDTLGAGQPNLMQAALRNAKSSLGELRRDDPVTGLMNERALRELLEHDWAVAKREQSTLAVVVFRVRDFAAYEKTFGRHASDACLRKVGQAIRRCLRRASDVVGRVNGDCFVALSHASEPDTIVPFAERIADNVRQLGLHHPKSTSAKFVTVSFDTAIAVPAEDPRPADQLLNQLVRTPVAEVSGG